MNKTGIRASGASLKFCFSLNFKFTSPWILALFSFWDLLFPGYWRRISWGLSKVFFFFFHLRCFFSWSFSFHLIGEPNEFAKEQLKTIAKVLNWFATMNQELPKEPSLRKLIQDLPEKPEVRRFIHQLSQVKIHLSHRSWLLPYLDYFFEITITSPRQGNME